MSVEKNKAMKSKQQGPNIETASTETPEGRALIAAQPHVNSAIVMKSFSTLGDQDLSTLTGKLHERVDAITDGNMKSVEIMLASQAQALDTLFASLANRASMNIGEYPVAAEMYLRLALKAQSQCRTTLETLATIKNPPQVAFVKQANIAHGHQQVNNGTLQLSRTEENAIPPIELMGNDHEQRLDTSASREAIDADPVMATVGKIHRA